MHTKTFRLSLRLTVAAVLLAVPVAVVAAPGPVTGIKAVEEGSSVRVSWTKLPEDEKVAFYRIFFASKSILGNDGAYDDFDMTEGNASSFVLQNLPAAQELFFSVLAVNDRGEESPFFAEEAHVTRASAAASAPQEQASSSVAVSSAATSQSVSSAEQASSTASTAEPTASVTLLSAEALSSTGVLVTFSAPVQIAEADAPTAFSIQDGSGHTLAITRLVVSGALIQIDTAPQNPAKVYQLRAQAVHGQRDDGVVMPLDPPQATTLFAGYSSGTGESLQPTVSASVADVGPLQATAQQREDGTYDVNVTWDTAGVTAREYRVAQTTDHGVTFGPAATLPGSAVGIRVPGVPGGELGIRVQVVSPDGTLSVGTLAFIRLPAAGALRGQVMGPTSRMTGEDGLTQSGVGTVALMAVMGAAAGVAVMRKRTGVGRLAS